MILTKSVIVVLRYKHFIDLGPLNWLYYNVDLYQHFIIKIRTLTNLTEIQNET